MVWFSYENDQIVMLYHNIIHDNDSLITWKRHLTIIHKKKYPDNTINLQHYLGIISSVAELERQVAASFWWSRSRNVMRLRFRLRRLQMWCSTRKVFKKWCKLKDFIVFSIRTYNNFHYTESERKRMLKLMLTLFL
jgi:hypothetical protein